MSRGIIISGAGSGIGHFLFEYFLNQGVFVVGLDKDERFIENSPSHSLSKSLICDLTNPQEVASTIDLLESQNITFDTLINNAGFIHNEPVYNLLNREKPKHSIDAWEAVLDANLSTAFLLTMEVVSKWIPQRTKGCIVNISSICAQGNIGQSAYSAAKAGIEALTKTWSREFAPFGIRTNCIAPGFMDTESTRRTLSVQKIEKLQKQIPLQRLGSSQEVASTVSFLTKNQYVNGAVIPLDGGLKL